MVIVRDLYGLKSIGAAWIKMFVETLHDMDYVSTVDDPGIYCKRSRKTNG